MKRVVSISLGSKKRDHAVEIELLGEPFRIERRGTEGDLRAAVALIQELDGQVAAFGIGGIDLYIGCGRRRYMLRDALPLARAARRTPIVDGSGLKNTLERRVVRQLAQEPGLAGRRALVVSAMDRFGMAEALRDAGCSLIIGDVMFALGIPLALHSLATLQALAAVVAPLACRLPFHMLYPTGGEQEAFRPRFTRHYVEADIIAGDFHYIRRHMPPRLPGKLILTNTVTADDVDLLRRAGVDMLVTTTPELGGRSFGTNVMEAVLVAAAGKEPGELTPNDYETMLDRLGFQPRIEHLQEQGTP